LTLESLSLAQTVSDPGMRLRGDLPTERAGLPWLVCQPPGWSPRVWTSTSCRNSKTARNLRRVSVLGSPASSSRDRGANPPGDHRECGRPPTCSELACCGRRPPRVVIVVPTRGSALSSSHYRGSTSSSCHYRGTNRGFSRLDWSAQPTRLVSQPRGDPRVATRGRPAPCAEL